MTITSYEAWRRSGTQWTGLGIIGITIIFVLAVALISGGLAR
jgi:hypothetical protein